MKDRIKKELDNLPDNFVVLMMVKSDMYEQANFYVLDYLINKKKQSGGYVSVNRPFSDLSKKLKQKQINSKNLFFIDCVTKSLGEKEQEVQNCVFLDSPSNLTDIGIALEQLYKLSYKHKFLFIDSLNTLSIYNDPERLTKFVHFLTGKMRMHNLKGILISLHEDTDKRLVNMLSQFCDKIIHF